MRKIKEFFEDNRTTVLVVVAVVLGIIVVFM